MKISKILSMVVLIVGLTATVVFNLGFEGLLAYWNLTSLLIIAIVTIPIIIISDCFGDYVNAIKIMFGQLEFSTKELSSALNSVNLAIKAAYLSGGIAIIIGIINILSLLNDPYILGPALAFIIITTLYVSLVNLFHYAISGRIKKELIYRGK